MKSTFKSEFDLIGMEMSPFPLANHHMITDVANGDAIPTGLERRVSPSLDINIRKTFCAIYGEFEESVPSYS